jgi:hypothetical protein
MYQKIIVRCLESIEMVHIWLSMLWGTGSLVRLQTLRHKLIFPKEMYEGRELEDLVRI